MSFLTYKNFNLKIITILSVIVNLFLLIFLFRFLPLRSNFEFNLEFVIYCIFIITPLIVISIMATKKITTQNNAKNKITILWSITVFILLYSIFFSYFRSSDYTIYLNDWCTSYSHMDIGNAMYNIVNISNYTPAYNYFLIFIAHCGINTLLWIKFFTYIFSLILACVIEKTINFIKKDSFNFLRFFLFILLPPVLIEFSAWGQCDAIYTTFALLSFYFALKHKSKLSFISIGLSFAFKMQFLFIVPLLFVMLNIKDKDGKNFILWKDIWIAPFMYIINFVPAIFGRNIVDILTIYFTQSTYYPALSSNCANLCLLYELFSITQPETLIYKILLTSHVIFTFSFIFYLLFFIFKLYKIKRNLTYNELVFFGLVFAFSMVFLMPKMLDRFYFIALCLSFIYYFIEKDDFSYILFLLVVTVLFFSMYINISFYSAFGVLGLLTGYINSIFIFALILIKLNKINISLKFQNMAKNII